MSVKKLGVRGWVELSMACCALGLSLWNLVSTVVWAAEIQMQATFLSVLADLPPGRSLQERVPPVTPVPHARPEPIGYQDEVWEQRDGQLRYLGTGPLILFERSLDEGEQTPDTSFPDSRAR